MADIIQTQFCPHCGVAVYPTNNFCQNCGTKILAYDQPISLGRQVYVYSVSLFAPPFGLIWGIKYLKSTDEKTRRAGIIAIVLTILSIVFTIWFTVAFFQSVQQQYNSYSNMGI